MNLRLTNKKALITGSTAGIGLGIAKLLASEGASVVINGRKQADVDEVVVKLIQETGNNNIRGIAADLSNTEEIQKLLKQLPETDILINNAGIFNEVPFEEITDEEWYEMFEVNVMSGIRLTRHYFPKMLVKNEGRVIFISSESALNIPVEMIHYGMSKTAQLSVSRGLAGLTKGSNVTVNAILPGPTWTRANQREKEEMAEKTGKNVEELKKESVKNNRPTSLIQRYTNIEEIANMVAYIASPLSSATNGTALRVDGGIVNFIA